MKKLLLVVLAFGLCVPAFAEEKKKPDPAETFKKLDADKDGKVSLAEFKGKREGDKATKAEETFKKKDKNSDGFLTLEEFMGKAK
ncbi:MAG: EF-hand domain-containing protein [Pirellulaceae bacterium]|nr:EF-hand domain-containing protein [Pirellulaceae bacterium]